MRSPNEAGTHIMPHGGKILIDELAAQGVGTGVPRSRRELSRSPRRSLRFHRDPDHPLPPRVRRDHDGGSDGKAHRQARHRLCDAWTGCRERARRRLRGARGRDADDPFHRAAADGDGGARAVPGDRHRAALLGRRQVGWRDPRHCPHSGRRGPCVSYRARGAARSCRDRSTRGRAFRIRRRGAWKTGRRSGAASVRKGDGGHRGDDRARASSSRHRGRRRLDAGERNATSRPSPQSSTFPSQRRFDARTMSTTGTPAMSGMRASFPTPSLRRAFARPISSSRPAPSSAT